MHIFLDNNALATISLSLKDGICKFDLATPNFILNICSEFYGDQTIVIK